MTDTPIHVQRYPGEGPFEAGKGTLAATGGAVGTAVGGPLGLVVGGLTGGLAGAVYERTLSEGAAEFEALVEAVVAKIGERYRSLGGFSGVSAAGGGSSKTRRN